MRLQNRTTKRLRRQEIRLKNYRRPRLLLFIKHCANAKRGADPVFSDGQLKNIKRAFSAGQEILSGRLHETEGLLDARGIEYMSPHDTTGEVFEKQLEWDEAIKISEATNISMSDAMILNALQSTKCPFIVSLDFDIGYAALSSSGMKDVIMSDENAKGFRDYHFPS